MENRKCPITSSVEFESYYVSNNDFVMTSDQRIIAGNLDKIIFTKSGIVANKKQFTKSEIESLYKEDYELNTSGQDEHVFYTKNGPVSRSQVYFDWVNPFIEDSFSKIIEIGCGEGRVLEKIIDKHPIKEIVGFDGSEKAAKYGQQKGLNIQQKIFLNEDKFPNADLFILIGVLEHVEDISSMIKELVRAVSPEGRLILSIPIQDYIGYDVFFKDHIWHFTVKQFQALLVSCGLNVVHTDSNNPINHGFGLFVCEKNFKSPQSTILTNEILVQKNNLSYWKQRLGKIDIIISKYGHKKIAVFGASEFFTFLYTYSSLPNIKIIACIDDSKEGTKKHGVSVFNSKWLDENKIDILMLAVNEKYNASITTKLAHLDLKIVSFFN